MTFQRIPRPVHVCKCGNHAWTNLTKGYVTLVSPQDAHILRKRAWTALPAKKKRAVYARSTYTRLHRVIMDAPADVHVDHEDGNGLDNRRSNLRNADNQKNSFNGRSHRDSTSKFKGVCKPKQSRKFVAQICVDGARSVIGYFDAEIDAAIAYDAAALKAFGEFARLNFPSQQL